MTSVAEAPGLVEFQNLIGQTFLVGNDLSEEDQTSLVLSSVTLLPHGHPGRDIPFSLTFEGSSEEPLDQGTYLFSSAGSSGYAIFIVPVAQDHSTRRYQAIFN